MTQQLYPVVFDLDGTLIDSAPDLHRAANDVLAAHGIQPLTLEIVRSFIGGGVDMLWQKIIAETGLDQADRPALVNEFIVAYGDGSGLTRLYPGVIDALRLLADRGHPLGICTNKPMAPTQAVLQNFGIAHLFGVVIAGDSLPVRKPDAAPLLAAFHELGGIGAFVGDSEFDAACAQNADVKFLLFTEGYRKSKVEDLYHSATFSDFHDLPPLVERHFSVVD